MEITDTYRIKQMGDNVIYYVYEGLCDNRETRWITKNKWDYKINVQFDGEGLYYTDSKGDNITVLEKEDPDDIDKWHATSRVGLFYTDDNADKITVKGALLSQEWVRENIEPVKPKKKINCSCGGIYTKNHKKRHEKTKKHQKYLSSII